MSPKEIESINIGVNSNDDEIKIVDRSRYSWCFFGWQKSYGIKHHTVEKMTSVSRSTDKWKETRTNSTVSWKHI